MTDPLVRLEEPHLVVKPGGQARTRVTVSNPGTIVEGYRLEVLGDVAGWAEVTPPEVQVYPQQEASAVVVVSPPAGTASPSGVLPFAVRARSVVDLTSQTTEEGDVEIGAVFGLQAKLTPVTSSGRWSAGHAVELTNWGNTVERLRLTATDPDERLAFLVHPDHVELPVGSTAVASVRVRPRRPLWRGSPARLPFQVLAAPEDEEPGPPPPPGTQPRRATLDGAMDQRPVLARGVVAATTVAVLLVAGLVGWAFSRPQPPASALGTSADVLTPTGVGALPDEAGAVAVSWARPDRLPEAYTVYVVDPGTTAQQVPKTIEERAGISGELEREVVEELEPGVEYCFQVVAQQGESKSERSEPVCAPAGADPAATATASTGATAPDTTAPTTTGGPVEPSDGTTEASQEPTAGTEEPSTEQSGPGTGGGTETSSGAGDLGPDEWVAVVYLAAEDGAVRGDPEGVLEQLRAEDYDAGLLESDDHPDLDYRENQLVVYVRGGFADQDAAERFCEDDPGLLDIGNLGRCLALLPGPGED